MTTETFQVEIRAAGTSLVGTAVRYNTPALVNGRRESFVPAAFGRLPDIRLNLQHSDQVVSDAIEWADSPESLDFVAHRVQPGVLRLVERGALQGASVEMRVSDDLLEGDMRTIRRAELVGLSVVDRPAHPGSRVETREASDQEELDLIGAVL